MDRKHIFLILGILLLLVFSYNFLDSSLTSWVTSEPEEFETGIVERVLDGDTIVINGEHIRMLGMNSPEKGEKYSEEAGNFLKENILNKTVKIYFGKDIYDLYGRKLGYIFYKGRNINSESVEKGFSNFYFPSGKNSYYQEFYNSWLDCLDEEINICEKSLDKCSSCINLELWDYKKDLVILKNICSFDCDLNDWTIKDEGRKKLFLSNVLKPGETLTIKAEDFGKTYVWTNTGDSIFIRDSFNKLVYFDSY